MPLDTFSYQLIQIIATYQIYVLYLDVYIYIYIYCKCIVLLSFNLANKLTVDLFLLRIIGISI